MLLAFICCPLCPPWEGWGWQNLCFSGQETYWLSLEYEWLRLLHNSTASTHHQHQEIILRFSCCDVSSVTSSLTGLTALHWNLGTIGQGSASSAIMHSGWMPFWVQEVANSSGAEPKLGPARSTLRYRGIMTRVSSAQGVGDGYGCQFWSKTGLAWYRTAGSVPSQHIGTHWDCTHTDTWSLSTTIRCTPGHTFRLVCITVSADTDDILRILRGL